MDHIIFCSFVTTKLFDFKYSNQIQIIFKQIHLINWWKLNCHYLVNADKTEYMCFNQNQNQRVDISSLTGGSLKLVDKFSYLGSSISSTENDINTQPPKIWSAIDKLSVIWKSDLSNKIKCNFFPAAVVSILLYECTTWILTKHIEKKLDANRMRMLWAILKKSWKQHPTQQQLYGHLPSISKTIQIRWKRHAGHY